MIQAKTGDWVQIHQVVLTPAERAPQVPDDTKLVPLELWVKGELLHDCEIGGSATIITATGRRVTGTLTAVNPRYIHDYGNFVPELQKAGNAAKELLFGGEK